MRASMRKWSGRLAVVLGLMAGSVGSAAAQAVVWTGPSDFDDASIGFAPIVVNQLQSITGGGYAHNHGLLGAVFSFDVHYFGGAWQNIFNTMIPSSDVLLSALVPPPVSFASGAIDGLRVYVNPTIGNGYHGFYGSSYAAGTTTFNFGVGASTVPEPGTLALVAGGVIGLVGIARRRRQAVAA